MWAQGHMEKQNCSNTTPSTVYLIKAFISKKAKLMFDKHIAQSRLPDGSHFTRLQGIFNGLRAPKGKIAMLKGSIACFSGLWGLYLSNFEKTTVTIVSALGFQTFKIMGSRAPVSHPLPLGAS